MFGIFEKSRGRSQRQEVIEEFTQIINVLREADRSVHIAVGHGLNMARAFFYHRYRGVEEFKNIPRWEQLNYLTKLEAKEEEIGKKDPQAAFGVGLFKMWIASVIQDDTESMQCFSQQLGWLSQTGELSASL